MENRDLVIEKVKMVIDAPSCCPELKVAAEKYLSSLNTVEEKKEWQDLIAELKLDVQTIDSVLELFNSELGVQLFGADTAKALAAQAVKVKNDGGKYCFCPACTAGKDILDMETYI